jgi:hypothetical protein
MILSHKLKFIFLKTNKTAGTSIEIALSKYCGPEDIITPISPPDEETRKSLGYPGPQNYQPYPLSAYSLRELARYFIKGKRKLKFFNHITASELKPLIDEHIWDQYFKFCFERNPWDRVISQYYFQFKDKPRPPLPEYLRMDDVMILKRWGYYLYTIDDEVVVDKIYRYENLAQELEALRQQLGISEKITLPRAKTSFRTDKRGYDEILDEADKERIQQIFRDEINLMGYRY